MQFWKGKSNEEGTEVSKRRKDGRGKEKPRHLYLVLDDWESGFSIRKIDLSFGDFDLSFGDPGQQRTHVLPGLHNLPSASYKFEAPRGYPRYFAGAFDSKILAMQPMDSKFQRYWMDGVLIYDVRIRSFIVGPRQMPDPVDPIFIPVGDRLFALAAGSFQLLYPPPYDESDWKDFVWTWHTLPEPPFLHQLVTCYAVHSNQRTIFVSIGGRAPATFSFDTAESVMNGDSRWKHHGRWKMPFNGRAYFVPELDAWVGLCGCRHDHRIGAIDVVSENVDGSQHDLALKLCKEELSCFLTDEAPIGATLISMGGGSKFCLLEYINKSDDELIGSSTSKENEEQQDHKCVMRLTTFSLKYDKNGGLQDHKCVMRLTTFSLKYDKNGGLMIGKSRQIQHYSVPSEVTWSMLETPVAFWM